MGDIFSTTLCAEDAMKKVDCEVVWLSLKWLNEMNLKTQSRDFTKYSLPEYLIILMKDYTWNELFHLKCHGSIGQFIQWLLLLVPRHHTKEGKVNIYWL